jgi:hypothetical protein
MFWLHFSLIFFLHVFPAALYCLDVTPDPDLVKHCLLPCIFAFSLAFFVSKNSKLLCRMQGNHGIVVCKHIFCCSFLFW